MHAHMKLTVLLLYIAAIYLISWIASRYIKTTSDYILGNRKLNTVTTAFGVGASDMSSWLMMAVPGSILVYGLSNIWIPLGITVGAYINWTLIAKKLREQTEKYGNALTIPWYLSNRFDDQSNTIRIATGLILLTFFTLYASSGLTACAIIIHNEFGLDYAKSLYIGATIIVAYTSIGGFVAVSWIDVFQGMLMLCAILIVPAAINNHLGGVAQTLDILHNINVHFLNPFYKKSTLEIISMLSWGLGYFGQVHILLRFMAAKSPEVITTARKICMTWMILALLGAVLVGLFGAALFSQSPLANPETVFLRSADMLFSSAASGMLLAAVFSAIMSTISAQLLAASSAVVEDIGLRIKKDKITDKTRLILNKTAVILITIAATLIAQNPKNNILSLVAYAWAGLGASFGPVIIFSLYWSKMTKSGAIAGMMAGGLTAILWRNFITHPQLIQIYEMIPAFLCSSLAIIITSIVTTSTHKDQHQL
jgi:sodium/proline symporter